MFYMKFTMSQCRTLLSLLDVIMSNTHLDFLDIAVDHNPRLELNCSYKNG